MLRPVNTCYVVLLIATRESHFDNRLNDRDGSNCPYSGKVVLALDIQISIIPAFQKGVGDEAVGPTMPDTGCGY